MDQTAYRNYKCKEKRELVVTVISRILQNQFYGRQRYGGELRLFTKNAVQMGGGSACELGDFRPCQLEPDKCICEAISLLFTTFQLPSEHL